MYSRILLFVLLLAATFSNAIAQENEILRFDKISHDFGIVVQGDTAIYSFEFTNVSKDTVTLRDQDIRPGCGCTKGKHTDTPIPPQGRGIVTAIFPTAGKGGYIMKNIAVFVGDKMITTLWIKFNIVDKTVIPTYTASEMKNSAKFTCDAPSFNFGKTAKGQMLLHNFSVKNAGKDTLKILKYYDACGGCVKYTMKIKEETVSYILPGKTATMEVTYQPADMGANENQLVLITNDKHQPKVTITVKAFIEPEKKSILQENPQGNMFGQ